MRFANTSFATVKSFENLRDQLSSLDLVTKTRCKEILPGRVTGSRRYAHCSFRLASKSLWAQPSPARSRSRHCDSKI